jgi:hypothetical protein
MTADRDQRLLAILISFMILVLTFTADAQRQAGTHSSVETRAEVEAFLSKASVVGDPGPPSHTTRSWRVSLDDGNRKHDAGVETADGSDPTRRDYKFNVAAYELNKVLGLNLVVPSVERPMSGRPASLTWWVDNFAMNELDRRRNKIDPPDLESWNQQVQAVRVFDELISTTYRDTSPALYLNTVWDNLLITRDWTIWITDHTGAFRIRRQLQDPESLIRCDRTLLGRLRVLNRELFQRTLGKYLSSEQLDALEARRELLVKHFDEQIARKGEAAVLYDLPPRQ